MGVGEGGDGVRLREQEMAEESVRVLSVKLQEALGVGLGGVGVELGLCVAEGRERVVLGVRDREGSVGVTVDRVREAVVE